jgi:hypothetical protein
MAFDLKLWGVVSTTANTKAPAVFSYLNATDNAATIKTSAYFNSKAGDIKIGDLIYMYSSDAISQILKVTAVSPNVTVAVLSGGLTVSHAIVYAGRRNTTGGAASEAFTVTGALTTDEVFITIHTKGGTPRTVVQAKVTSANTVTVEFSGDPSTDHIISYELIRAQV